MPWVKKPRSHAHSELRWIIVGALVFVALLTAYLMYQHDEAQVKTWERALTGDVEPGMDDVLFWARLAVYEDGAKNALTAFVIMALLALVVGAYGTIIMPIIAASAWFFLSREPALMPWGMLLPIGVGTLLGMVVNILEGYTKWPQRLFNWATMRRVNRSSCG